MVYNQGMKKWYWLLVVALILILSGLAVYQKNVQQNQTLEYVPSKTSLYDSRFRDLLSSPLTSVEVLNQKYHASSDCFASLKKLTDHNLEVVLADEFRQTFTFPPICQKLIQESFRSPVVMNFFHQCVYEARWLGKKNCRHQLVHLRTMAFDLLLDSKEDNSSGELLNRVLSGFLKGELLTHQLIRKNIQRVQYIINDGHQQYDFYKLLYSLKILNEAYQQHPDPEMENLQLKLAGFNQEDDHLQELHFYRLFHLKQFTVLKKMATSFLNNQQLAAESSYYLAHLSWLDGKRDQAIDELKRAYELNRQEPKYHKTLLLLQNNQNPGNEIFVHSFPFRLINI